jgi:hypothetical protein
MHGGPEEGGVAPWGIGLTYRHQLAAHMALDIRTADLPIELPVLTVGGVVQYDPPTLIAEGFFRPLPDLMLVANLTTRFWEAFPGAQIATTSTGRIAPAPNFKNWPSPRIAAEGTFHDRNFTIAVRGGYAYEHTPSPPARYAERRATNGDPIANDVVAFRVLDNDRHILTLGAGWTIHLGRRGERLVLDLYGQLHILSPRTHSIGRTEVSTEPLVTEGFVLAGGWTLGVEF